MYSPKEVNLIQLLERDRKSQTRRKMDSFDPFKDYLELSFPRTGHHGEAASMFGCMQEGLDDLSWLNGSRMMEQSMDVSGQLTPGSSCSESAVARPLLGRRNSTDEPSSLQTNNNYETFWNRRRAISVGSDSDVSPEVISDIHSGVWGQEIGAWTDISSEVKGGQPASWNGNSLGVHQSNGSTGFFTETERSKESQTVEKCSSPWMNEGLPVTCAYPQYSIGYDVDYPGAVNHVAILLNKLVQQTNAGSAPRNGFRGSFNSLDEGKHCAFCKKNRERREFYTTHIVKDSWGKVICPILRKYICPNCGATGDNAHTLRHCPVGKNENLNL